MQGQRLEGFHQHGRLHAGRDLDDQVHVTALGPKPRQVLRGALHVHIVERIDPVTVALVHDGADSVLRVPFLHRHAEVVVVMRIAVERVDAQHHPADFGAAEFHLWHLDLTLRLGRLRRRECGTRPCKTCRQGCAAVQKASTCVRHEDTPEAISLTGLYRRIPSVPVRTMGRRSHGGSGCDRARHHCVPTVTGAP